MVEKGIRGGIYQSVNRYAIADKKHMEDYDKNYHILNTGMYIICMVKRFLKSCQ